MSDKEFVEMLQKAIAGDSQAMVGVIELYEKLICKHSYIDGKYDEDCAAEIQVKLITAIPKFKI